MKRIRTINETWKNVTIDGYEKYYQISNLGRLKSVDRIITDSNYYNRTRFFKGQIVPVRLVSSGYVGAVLSVAGKRKDVLIHRLVSEAFIPNLKNKPQINHKDGNKENNNVTNLEWVTSKENHAHSFLKLGRKGPNLGKFGSNAPRSRIVEQYSKDNELIATYGSLIEAAQAVGLDSSGICHSCKGRIPFLGGYKWAYADRTFTVTIKNGVSQVKQS